MIVTDNFTWWHISPKIYFFIQTANQSYDFIVI